MIWHPATVQVLAVSDTHAPRFWKRCPTGLIGLLQTADYILHAGDVCTAAVLDELADYAPVSVVLGNNDGAEVAAWGADPTAELVLAGVRIAMVHDSGTRAGRAARLRRRFTTADLVVFGHSHIPAYESLAGLQILNPGSPTDKRRQPHPTAAVLQLQDGKIDAVRFVELD